MPYRVSKQVRIERAIVRSRQARAAVTRRRRRAAALIAFLAIVLTGGGVWSIGALTGNDMVEAAVSNAQSLVDLIGARSPGGRTQGELIKTKHARALAAQRLAPKRQVPSKDLAPKAIIAPVAELFGASQVISSPMSFGQPLPLTKLESPPPTLGEFVIPGGGTESPPGGSPPKLEPKEPLLVPSAVPEPATWATMLLGFGLIGWRVRRARSLGAGVLGIRIAASF